MIYYNNKSVKKLYNGTDLVTKMNKTVGEDVGTYETLQELIDTHTVVSVGSGKYNLEPSVSGLTFFRINLQYGTASKYIDLYREDETFDKYFGIRCDATGGLFKSIDGYSSIKSAADSTSCQWAYYVDTNIIEVDIVAAIGLTAHIGQINNGFNTSFISFLQHSSVAEDKAIFQYVTDGEEPIDYTKEYLTFEPISSAVSFTHKRQQFQYSLDNGNTWSSITSSASTVTVGVGQKMLLKGAFIVDTTEDDQNCFVAEGGTWKAYGNLLSVVYGDNFITATTLDRNGLMFAFYHCQSLVDITNLTIPITSVMQRGLRGAFRDTGISSAPNNLLPATTLSSWCYMGTFEDCGNLVNAPELPAQTVPTWGYYAMFNNCHNLNYVKCLATSKGSNATTLWLNNVSSTGTFIKKAGASWSSGKAGIPNGWTVIEE